MNISFVGGGVMAEAIIGGIITAKLEPPESIRVGEPVAERRSYLNQTYGVKAFSENLDVVKSSDMIVLSVKPQTLPQVLAELKNANLGRGTAILSIVAGVKTKELIDGLGHPAIIRVMPNTPAQIGSGMTVWTASQEVSQENIKATREILSTLGKELFVTDEKLVDMATALSASGPAYVFMFIEAMIDAGVYLGMPRDTARTLVLQTVLGSTKLVQESGRHPADLKDMVTSPGGTTIEAVLSLEEAGFRASILQAVIAAYEKSKELGEGH